MDQVTVEIGYGLSSFETALCALLRMRSGTEPDACPRRGSQILMVRSAAQPRVSNHEARMLE